MADYKIVYGRMSRRDVLIANMKITSAPRKEMDPDTGMEIVVMDAVSHLPVPKGQKLRSNGWRTIRIRVPSHGHDPTFVIIKYEVKKSCKQKTRDPEDGKDLQPQQESEHETENQ
ncbi:MAG: hypothetical protein WAN51_11020 [Alphaproteobacteria bacterium]